MKVLLALLALLAFGTQADAASIRCARIDTGSDSIVKFETFRQGACPPHRLHKNIKWLPAPTVAAPAFDPATQVRERLPDTVGATEVTQNYTVRAKTAGELDVDKDDTIDGINLAVVKALCRLENHDRVSDGKAVWTDAQCLAAFKGLLP